MEFIYRGWPYQCSGKVLPKGPIWCNAESLLYEDGLFDQDAADDLELGVLGTAVPQDVIFLRLRWKLEDFYEIAGWRPV